MKNGQKSPALTGIRRTERCSFRFRFQVVITYEWPWVGPFAYRVALAHVGFGVDNGGRSLVVVVSCVKFCRKGVSSFGSYLSCVLLPCVLASAAGVVGGTFELAGGGVVVDSTDAGLSLGALGAGAGGFTWGFSDILKSAFQ